MARTVLQWQDWLDAQPRNEFRVLPIWVLRDKRYLFLSYAGKLAVLYLWQRISYEKGTGTPRDEGRFRCENTFLEASGIRPEHLANAIGEVISAGFFKKLGPEQYQLAPADEIPF